MNKLEYVRNSADRGQVSGFISACVVFCCILSS